MNRCGSQMYRAEPQTIDHKDLYQLLTNNREEYKLAEKT